MSPPARFEGESHPFGGLWSLLDMLEIKGRPFLGTMTELHALILLIGNIPDKSANLAVAEREGIISQHVERLAHELHRLGSRSALASVDRLKRALADESFAITYDDVRGTLADIQSRFADHLDDIKLFALNEGEASLFGSADEILSQEYRPVAGFALAFPKASFELEECAKCYALGRFTASVFHAMRTLECGIGAMCGFLDIPDPVKPAERNWALILTEIKKGIDRKWPVRTRLSDPAAAKFVKLHATLDAVKHPWRNATMHVEMVYSPHDALHIARCVGLFMLDLSVHCDENGLSPDQAPAIATVLPEKASEEESAA